MAKSNAVWGIDIGQSALKALRCRPHESDDQRLVVEDMDYVEYPKLLSQPDADPEEIVAEALQTFLERKELKGDEVAVSVSGQAGLARFIKLPPVESKKIPDIVKYEARQQIPFALEDVVWDYQSLAGGNEDDGFALEKEIGLFAMKRDQVAQALEPLQRAGVEVDYIQLTPLALYNYACFDRLRDLDLSEFDPEDAPKPIVLLSIGVDTTDLVITNGFRVWQRNIQIGGSHFTKALTKELKLTFAKAEEQKKNATQVEDPKALFQAMRPVFSELAGEVQRSIGFCTSNNRWAADPTEVIAMGNAMKLPGLQRFLSQNLDTEVTLADDFEGLAGGSVTASSEFQENRLSFPVAYGLCVQALGHGAMATNLLPDEIVTRRLIQAKKPWAVAAAAALMLGLVFNYTGHVSALGTVDTGGEWSSALSSSKGLTSRVGGWSSTNQQLKSTFEELEIVGENLASNVDGRLLWPELWKAVSTVIPQDTRPEEEREQSAEDVASRKEVHITSLDCQQFEDLSTWFATVQPLWDDAAKTREERLAEEEAEAEPEEGAEEDLAEGEAPLDEGPGGFGDAGPFAGGGGFGGGGLDGEEGSTDAGPSGPGWVLQLVGHHFHNSRGSEIGETFVRNTLIDNLMNGSVELPDGESGEMIEVPLTELGISYPVVITQNKIRTVQYDPEAGAGDQPGARRRGPALGGPGFGGPGLGGPGRGRPGRGGPGRGLGRPGADGVSDEPELWKLKRYDFVVQFAWTPTLRHERLLARSEAESEESDDGFDSGGF